MAPTSPRTEPREGARGVFSRVAPAGVPQSGYTAVPRFGSILTPTFAHAAIRSAPYI
jgi:hypothetical protein